MARPIDGRWSARVEVSSPGQTPRTESPLQLAFAKVFDQAKAAVDAAIASATEWVESNWKQGRP